MMMNPNRKICNIALLSVLFSIANSFTMLPYHYLPTTTSTTFLHSKNADFEFQEMRAILDAMKTQRVPSKSLDMTKRIELESYVNTVVRDRIPPNGSTLDIPLVSTYRLAFSNQTGALDSLPADATVILEFQTKDRLLYELRFSERTLGLQKISAECSYELNEQTGVLIFTYETISTDVLGIKQLPVGFFGLLKGRKNYVVTAYFDGDYWIEVAYDSPAQTSTYTNVYVRDDSDVWRKE